MGFYSNDELVGGYDVGGFYQGVESDRIFDNANLIFP
jgi:hypothetical protein